MKEIGTALFVLIGHNEGHNQEKMVSIKKLKEISHITMKISMSQNTGFTEQWRGIKETSTLKPFSFLSKEILLIGPTQELN